MRIESPVSDSSRPKFLTGSGGAAVPLTIAADVNQFHVIDWIAWSYASAPTAGSLTVTIGGVVVFQIAIASAGHGFLQFDRPLFDPEKNKAVVVTLANGGVAGMLNVRYR